MRDGQSPVPMPFSHTTSLYILAEPLIVCVDCKSTIMVSRREEHPKCLGNSRLVGSEWKGDPLTQVGRRVTRSVTRILFVT